MTAAEQVRDMLATADEEAAADRFAEIVEDRIDFSSKETYFRTLLALPQPFRDLYAALIFNTSVRADGLADTVHKYDDADFIACLTRGLESLDETELLAVVNRCITYMARPDAAAHRSPAPNVAMDEEMGDVHRDYFARNKSLMRRIGRFLHRHHDLALDAAKGLDEGPP